MIQTTYPELVNDLRMRRAVGDKPPILLLGAGASVESGIGAMDDLFRFFGCNDFKSFCAKIGPATAAERYRYLSDFLQTRRPDNVSPGYRALASLCAQGFFDLVLTTNLDPLLDDALAAARLWRRDYLLIVNGMIRPERLQDVLRGQSPRVKVVKLHGDLFQRVMAWTTDEMDLFLTEVEAQLNPAVAGRDFLVVGYSLRDERVRRLVETAGGTVWFTHPSAIPTHLQDKTNMRAVVAPECAFENFFTSLANGLQVEFPAQPLDVARFELQGSGPVADGVETVDDLLNAVFGIVGPGGAAVASAFLLAEPRVLVCNRYDVAAVTESGHVPVSVRGGRSLKARVLAINEESPFGPALLEPPAEIRFPGLRLETSPLKAGAMIQIAVAAGEKTGVSSGPVIRIEKQPISIEPIGAAKGLVSLRSYVAPGACGGPVVDQDMNVRGYIVAGTDEPTNPYSLAFPSTEWAPFVRGRKPARTAKQTVRRR